MLMNMVEQKLQALPDATAARALRPEVAVMLKHYVDGEWIVVPNGWLRMANASIFNTSNTVKCT